MTKAEAQMASNKGKATSADSGAPSTQARPNSYTRFKSPLRTGVLPGDERGPSSTLPPPPFASEAEVPGLEWWLNAHMDLASELLWLEQLLEALPEGGAHLGTMRRLVSHVEAIRDALYELYCDAADERVSVLLGAEGVLETRVRLSYAWCTRVVGALGSVANGLRPRADEGPDWAAAKAAFREADRLYPQAVDAVRDGVRALSIDFGSPIEPLRNLPHDLEQLLAACEELRSTLAKRFG
jgi:hypothetical protein